MDTCIFCKIARGEIPSRKVYEDAEILGFHDRGTARVRVTLLARADVPGAPPVEAAPVAATAVVAAAPTAQVQMAALDPAEPAEVATTAPEPETTTAPAPETKLWQDPEKSLKALENFKYACKAYLPALTDEHWERARVFFDEYAMHRLGIFTPEVAR